MPDAKESIPTVQIIPTSEDLDGSTIIKGITSDCAIRTCESPAVAAECKWIIKNKYYTADVLLQVMAPSWPVHWSAVEETCEAIIIYWDNKHEEALKKLDDVFSKMGGFQPEVCLLVCDNFNNSVKISKEKAIEWCINHLYELIELEPSTGSDCEDDAEDDFPESLSFERIKGALNANSWSNIVLDDGNAEIQNPLLPESKDPFVGYAEEGDYNEDMDDFDELFTRFKDFRITASSMTRDDRLDYAEKVTLSFMKSMGVTDDDLDEDNYVTGDTKVVAEKLYKQLHNVDDDDDSANTSESESLQAGKVTPQESIETSFLKKDKSCVNQEDKIMKELCRTVLDSEDELSDKEIDLMANDQDEECALAATLGFPVISNEVSSLEIDSSASSEQPLPPLMSYEVTENEELTFEGAKLEDIENELALEELKTMLARKKEKELCELEQEGNNTA